MLRDWTIGALEIFDLLLLAYFLVINTIYLVFSLVAYGQLRHHRKRWTARELGAVMRSPATPGISVLVPAFNEALNVVESVRSLLFLNYPQFEVIVVNDGSTDGTLDLVVEGFELVRAPVSYKQAVETSPVRAVYRSISGQDLTAIDKVNGGKADAINAGLNAARYPLVCVIDADSVLEEHSLTRAVLPFIENPTTVAVGGIVRLANGCKIDHGRVVEVGLPKSHLATFQVVEYLRAFLAGRVTLSMMNGLMIISGAFGVFKRASVVAVGGFRQDTVGEDMELVAKLHSYYRERGEKYRIVFQPDPVCWTEAPETIRTLARQRDRWQRGTLQVLSLHWRLFCNPRYGLLGLFVIPYYVLFEGIGPIIELFGYVFTILAVAFGLINWTFAVLLFLSAVVYGAMISLASVILEEVSFRRYPRLGDLLRLAFYGVLENFGYRQMATWWRVRGVFRFLNGERGWGDMTRKGFEKVNNEGSTG
ncbi:MAG: glycosyltransferase family 2 protein [Acidobacteria bacterium]|nr:glycosyltransferase family 2 protein [Acidobacteriota bacterium]